MAPVEIARRGLMLILSSPSGAGKTTLTRTLIEQKELELQLSISVTTRARRPSEVGDVHYHFIEKDQFLFRRDRGDLLEWAEGARQFLWHAAAACRKSPV
jgi:guanylate kinase